LKVIRLFGGACSLHLQGGRVKEARNQREAGGKQNPGSLLGLFFVPEEGKKCSYEKSIDFRRAKRLVSQKTKPETLHTSRKMPVEEDGPIKGQ
jgi:hypothetical protein